MGQEILTDSLEIPASLQIVSLISKQKEKRSFLVFKTCNTANFTLKITYFPLFFTLFPQNSSICKAKAHYFALIKANFEALAKAKMILSFC